MLLFLNIQNIHPITVRDKLKINQDLNNAKSMLFTGDYNRAKDTLLTIKRNFGATEFNIIANYYLALLEYNNENHYPALHYAELALQEIDNKKLHDKYRSDIYNIAGLLYYKTGLYDKALECFEKSNEYNLPSNINKANLYMSLIYYNRKNISKSSYYFRKIDRNTISNDDTKIYEYLNNFIGWRIIATGSIGYKDPNVNCIFAENDEIYIGLWHGGLIQYNYISDTYKFFTTPEICGDEIRGICSTDKQIWIGTTTGVSTINKRDGSVNTVEEFINTRISSISSDKNNIIIGTLGDGVFTFNTKTKKRSQILESGNISSVYIDDNSLMIGTYNNDLYEYKNSKISNLKNMLHIKNPVTAISKIGTTYCFATYGAGIITYDKNKAISKIFSSSNTNIINNDYFLTAAKYENIFYCGSLGNGIYYIENNKINRFNISDYYSGNDIQKIIFYENYMFIATLGEGVIIRMIN